MSQVIGASSTVAAFGDSRQQASGVSSTVHPVISAGRPNATVPMQEIRKPQVPPPGPVTVQPVSGSVSADLKVVFNYLFARDYLFYIVHFVMSLLLFFAV